ncbi:hypothetical protein P3T27_002133 [Kitasatospora sp. MAA19]|uniref:hypothetical protein n=1 Tax=unclassified Kitasatospora TaxID=2633591 RepID=UPI00247517DD|nr:hypothetical protein [Kitasatospora sp. MAA19]MDH6705423.1 hypothetical protein [Kitasatospora sp. MAA19]
MSEDPESVLSNLVPHEVVRDLKHRDADGKPREGAFVEILCGAAFLRPLGGGREWTTRPHQLQPCDPREIAPGTGGNPRRRLMFPESA